MTDAPIMASAMLNAMLEANRGPDDIVYVDPDAATDAFAMALAAMMEADPALSSPRAIRIASEEFGKLLKQKITHMRERYEKTGKRLWDADIVRAN